MNTTKHTMARDDGRGWKTRVLPHGRHQGKTLLWVVENDPGYLWDELARAKDDWWRGQLDAATAYLIEREEEKMGQSSRGGRSRRRRGRKHRR